MIDDVRFESAGIKSLFLGAVFVFLTGFLANRADGAGSRCGGDATGGFPGKVVRSGAAVRSEEGRHFYRPFELK